MINQIIKVCQKLEVFNTMLLLPLQVPLEVHLGWNFYNDLGIESHRFRQWLRKLYLFYKIEKNWLTWTSVTTGSPDHQNHKVVINMTPNQLRMLQHSTLSTLSLFHKHTLNPLRWFEINWYKYFQFSRKWNSGITSLWQSEVWP